MDWIAINSQESQRFFSDFCNNGEIKCDEKYTSLRKDICMLFFTALKCLEINEKQLATKNYSYQMDLLFGIKLYLTLNEVYGMNVRAASNDGIWRYLSTCVVPDLVAKRYGIDHPDRFWKKPKRLWLRVLWWYIYLSWQGTEQSTYDVLKNNSTDEILQLVDRCGKGGYRVNLYRIMMKRNSLLDINNRRKQQLFRKMMVLNTARVQAVEPSLTNGGNIGYVNALLDYLK